MRDPKDRPPTEEELKIMRELDIEMGILSERPSPPLDIRVKDGGERFPWKEIDNVAVAKHDRGIVGGVFSDLADYFEMSDMGLFIMRIIAVLGVFAYGITIPLYILAWIIKPKKR